MSPGLEAFGAQERHEEKNEQRRRDQRAECEVKAHGGLHLAERAGGCAHQRERTEDEKDGNEIGHGALRMVKP
jgi:hypothetical protein